MLALVAPLVGAWIEIKIQQEESGSRCDVAPLVGAWIEIDFLLSLCQEYGVAPLVGAWIEITPLTKLKNLLTVAPLVGAWIEIPKVGEYATVKGRSPRGSVD